MKKRDRYELSDTKFLLIILFVVLMFFIGFCSCQVYNGKNYIEDSYGNEQKINYIWDIGLMPTEYVRDTIN